MSDPKDTIGSAAERAKSAVADTADTLKETVNRAGNTAVAVAREAGRQTAEAADTIYGQGSDVLDVVEDTIRQNPLLAVLTAAAIGYGIGRYYR
jgi:ElaB/YqjD/DUF883 family membrane-anchored ribosome-binding protein